MNGGALYLNVCVFCPSLVLCEINSVGADSIFLSTDRIEAVD